MGNCPIDATQRVTVNKPGLVYSPSIDVCDMHMRKITKDAKKGSVTVCPLSYIEEQRKKEGASS